MSCRNLPRLLKCAAAPSPPLSLSCLPCNKDLGWIHCWAPGWGGGAPSQTPTPEYRFSLNCLSEVCLPSLLTSSCRHCRLSCIPVLVLVFAEQAAYKMPLLREAERERKVQARGADCAWQQPRPAFSCPCPSSFPSLPQPFSSTHGIRQPTCEGQCMNLKAFPPPRLCSGGAEL